MGNNDGNGGGHDRNHMILPGGGLAGFVILGALDYIFNHICKQEDICGYTGTSIGAVIGSLLAVGITPIQILIDVCNMDFMTGFMSEVGNVVIANIFKNKGMTSFAPIAKCIGIMFTKHIGYIPTLGDIYEKYNKEVYVTAFCLNTYDTVIVSHENYPELNIIDALTMTAAVPFIFDVANIPLNKKETRFVDGGIQANTPFMNLVSYHKTKKYDHVYIISFMPSDEVINNMCSTPVDDSYKTFTNLLSTIWTTRESLISEFINTYMRSMTTLINLPGDMKNTVPPNMRINAFTNNANIASNIGSIGNISGGGDSGADTILSGDININVPNPNSSTVKWKLDLFDMGYSATLSFFKKRQ